MKQEFKDLWHTSNISNLLKKPASYLASSWPSIVSVLKERAEEEVKEAVRKGYDWLRGFT